MTSYRLQADNSISPTIASRGAATGRIVCSTRIPVDFKHFSTSHQIFVNQFIPFILVVLHPVAISKHFSLEYQSFDNERDKTSISSWSFSAHKCQETRPYTQQVCSVRQLRTDYRVAACKALVFKDLSNNLSSDTGPCCKNVPDVTQ